ncbi:pyridoxamine 5'-phosphate oxidase family protein [Aquincola sp. MAHUQ-54]|uniref:Pyridoxamine 5'-phosphate oxidase family protein n=1 Tax=Aquincola agrisoli TaxID=3119538 RepID=A0AAW9Q419_9BURK
MFTSRIESLHILEAACWQELERAASDRQHAWRLMTLATVNGDEADARTIVLREAHRASQSLVFYSDARAGKVRQIEQQPKGTLVMWSSELGWQLRLRVRMQVATSGADVTSRWAQVRLTSAAADYLAGAAPGSALSPLVPERATREHFAVVTAQVQSLDWMELHPDGHRRALFEASQGTWVQP